jgi:hypothetical protein
VLSGVEGNAKALKIGKLALDLDAKAGESAVKARIDSPVAADIAAQTLALEKLAGSLDLANPQMPMKQLKLPLSGSLRADLAKQSAALDLGTRFDESKIALKLKVAKFAPLALGFDLDIDTLNVDKYLPPKKAEEKVAASPAPAGKDAAADKLDFSALKGHDVNGALRIGALQVSKLKLAKAECEDPARRRPPGRGAALHESLRRQRQRQPVAERGRQPARPQAEPQRDQHQPAAEGPRRQGPARRSRQRRARCRQPRRQRRRDEEGAGGNGLAQPQGRRDQGHQPGAEHARHQGQAGHPARQGGRHDAKGQSRRKDRLL